MKTTWIKNLYHRKRAGIIFAKKKLSNEEMDKIVDEYIETEKQKIEDKIRSGDGFIIRYSK